MHRLKVKKMGFPVLMAIVTLLLIVSYLYDSSQNIVEVLSVTFVVVILYIVIKGTYMKLLGSNTAYSESFAMPNMKKRYIIFFSVYGFLLNNTLAMIYTSNFGLPKNEQSVSERYENQHTFEMDIIGGIQAPILEEVLFRGFLFITTSSLFCVFKGKLRNVIAVNVIFGIVSSLLFGLMHGVSWGKLFNENVIETDFIHLAPYLIAGIIYSTLYLCTKTIIAPITAHMLNNISTLDFATTIIYLELATVFIIGMYLLKRKKRYPFSRECDNNVLSNT